MNAQHITRLIASISVAAAVASSATAVVIPGTYTTAGSTTGLGPWTMTASSAPSTFSLLRFIPSVPVTFANLSHLEVPYDCLLGGIAAGAPRFTFVIDWNGNNVLDPIPPVGPPGPGQDGIFHMHWGPPGSFVDPTTGAGLTTGNLMALTDVGRYDLSPVGGSGYTDRAAALALCGGKRVWRASLTLDTFLPYPDRHFVVSAFNVQGTPTPPNTLSLNATGSCYHLNDTVVVNIDVAGLAVAAAGGQFFINFDDTKLQFLSAVPGDPGLPGSGLNGDFPPFPAPANPNNPFEVEVYQCNGQTVLGFCNLFPNRLDYAVGVLGGGAGSGSINNNTMAVLRFKAIGEVCNTANLVRFRDNVSGPLLPPTRLTNEFGAAINPNLIDMGAITIDSTAPVLTCPANTSVECPTAPIPANTGTATAVDVCDGTPTIAYNDVAVNILGSPAGWAWRTENTASGSLVYGPPVPPAGAGSFRMLTGAGTGPGLGGKTYLFTNLYDGMSLLSLTNFKYWTYVTATANPNLAPYLNLYVDWDNNGSRDTTLVFEPTYVTGGAIPSGWQQWNALGAANAWWYNTSFGLLTNPAGEYHPLSYYLAIYPNAKIVNWAGLPGTNVVVGQASGGPWANFDGSVDKIDINAASNNFEPVSGVCSQTIFRFWSATDDCNNTSTCTQTINVVDTTEPSITCPPNISVNADAGGCDSTVSLIGPGYSLAAGDFGPGSNPGTAEMVYDSPPHNWAVRLVSPAPTPGPTYSYAVISHTPPPGTLFNMLTTLSTDYKMLQGCFGGGSPRFELAMDLDNNGSYDGSMWVYLGTPPGFTDCPTLNVWQSSGNFIGDITPRYDLTGIGGPYLVPHAAALSLYGTARVMEVSIPVDGGWIGTGTQDLLIDNMTVNAAVASGNGPSASDTCDADVVITGVRSDSEPLDSPFPSGVTSILWTATDNCGNVDTCTQTVTVSAFNELELTIELQPNIAPTGTLTRCIRLELWNCPGGPPTIVDAPITFNVTGPGPNVAMAASVTVLVPCGEYDCMTARDRLHTLRRTDEGFSIVGTKYVANYTGDPGSGGDWLIGGNLNDDQFVDILDFGTFVSQYNVNYGTGNTTCSTPYPHADVSGNGLVTVDDFSFIQTNFLKFHEPNCCGAPRMGGPITRISVKDLIRQGMQDLVVADLNRDGWLDTTDAQIFMNGGGAGGGGGGIGGSR